MTDTTSDDRLFNGSFEKGLKGWFLSDDVSGGGKASAVSDLSSSLLYGASSLLGGPPTFDPTSGVYDYPASDIRSWDRQFDFHYGKPTDGTHAFWTPFDGDGPGVISLSQDVSLADSKSDVLHFDMQAAWDLNFGKSATPAVKKIDARHFEVEVRDQTTGKITDFDLLTAKGFSTQHGVHDSVSLDLSAFAGDDITLQFRWLVPQSFTGPASFTLDNVSLNANEYDGTAGADLLHGAFYDDHLYGFGGADTLRGGVGADVLTGGKGADVFQYTSIHQSMADGAGHLPLKPMGIDTITDLQGHDRVDVSAIDANHHLEGDQAFVLVSSFDGHKGEAMLSYDAKTDQTTFALDVNGDGQADMTILIDGQHLDASNYVL